ncbi:MAG: hypothetical protein AAB855_00005 [Patescibacteria group bacterium]
MNLLNHLQRLKESLEVLEEGIEKGLVERQRSIGFHTSAACADMLELFLHKNNLIDPGFILKHEWLKSKNKTTEKLPFTFKNKDEILLLIFKIEEKRDLLCYGKPQSEVIIREVLDSFRILQKKFREIGLHEI